MTSPLRFKPPARQSGTSLVEALIGLLVIAIGMLGSAHWQIRLRQAVDLARQQSEASRMAQQELENIRSFVSNNDLPGLTSFEAIGSASMTATTPSNANTAYLVQRQVRSSQLPALKELELRVSWADRSGSQRGLGVSTLLGGQAPALILPLGQAGLPGDSAPLLGRHAAIPRDAHDLGNGRSVFKPVTAGEEAWLFDNRSGRIRAQCSGVPASKANHQLASTDLSHCTASDLLLLSGRVRRSAAPPPLSADPGAARDMPPPMSIGLQLSSLGHPQPPRCLGETVRMVDAGSVSSPRPIAVANDATPSVQGYAGWSELGDRFWRYHCAVAPAAAAAGADRAAPSWSGRLQITALGWTIASTAGTQRICRYSADTDGSGQVDRAAEAPDHHVNVSEALVEQNFLVIEGGQACPSAPASALASGSLPWFDGNPATVPHQP